jgi:serine protease AprX
MKKNTIKGSMLFALGFGFCFNLMAQTPEQKAQITKDYDQVKHNELQQELEARWEKTLQMAKENNWPLKKIVNGKLYAIGGVTEDNQPYYKTSDNNNGPASGAITARVNHIRTGGNMNLNVNGQGMELAIWEVGNLRATHEQIVGRVDVEDGSNFDGDDGPGGANNHGTHVACTMIGSGTGLLSARGLAYQAAKLHSYDSNNDSGEANTAANNGMLVSNHSYGIPPDEGAPSWWQGAYIDESREWDAIMFNNDYYQMVVSAGNSRDGEELGELIGNKNSKNALVVAAINGVNFTSADPAITMSSFSTYGPTDDGRIKPDIAMKGVQVRSAFSSSDSDYGNLDGTSMASPGVAGTVALIQQYYNEKKGAFMRAATLRGLVVHTATEAGTAAGPDYRFGWGVIDAQKAVEVIDADVLDDTIIRELTLTQGETFTFQINANISEEQPLKVTIAWTDPAGAVVTQNTTSNKALINDLDLRVQIPGALFPYTPWKLQGQNTVKGDNNRDNVEVVEITDAADGQCTITVNHKGTLQGGSQKYSMIISYDTNAGTGENAYNSFKVYPNPATDMININYGDAAPAAGKVTLYDLQGRQVKSFNQLVTAIDVNDLSSGLYMLNIEHNGNIESQKVIIK